MTDARPIRITTWNCRAGSAHARLCDLAPLESDLLFLQECVPGRSLPLAGDVQVREINARKAVALLSPSGRFNLTPLPIEPRSSLGSLAARVDGVESFAVLGIWAQGRDYAVNVVNSVRAHSALLAGGPVIVLGDFNSGTDLSGAPRPRGVNDGLLRLLEEEFALVSAYHAFHKIEAGVELHPTYYHQFNEQRPWHIDFCLVPRAWVGRILDVQVADYGSLAKVSDHRPVTVTLSTRADV